MGKRFKPEEIIMKLREVEIQQGKGWTLQRPAARLGSPMRHITVGARNTVG